MKNGSIYMEIVKSTQVLKQNFAKSKRFFVMALLVLLILPTIVYFQSLNNEITNWDDNSYITSNKAIKTLHGDSIGYTLQKTFSSYVLGNYHPLTMLTYCFITMHISSIQSPIM